ncbi:MAG TPA: MFS transporter [Usitatibacter sp.]|jgi:MFS family permease|nr:MFS transporter [Usitatibacter sp.]
MSAGQRRAQAAIPRGVWVLGFVSLFMDVSSEMIHALLPLYLTVVLGSSALTVGLIEGVAESTALIVKVFSGTLSDRWQSRKGLTAFGYGLAALSKPLFALATGPALVFVARFIDRIGKGIRGAPRDALIADITPPEVRGAAFGLRQSLDTVGAFAGPLLAMALMLAWHDDFRAVFWVAVVPALLSFALVTAGVREPDGDPARAGERRRMDFGGMGALGSAYWWVVAAAVALTLARFSEAFLILRAGNLGIDPAYAPLVLVAMNVVYSLAAYPVGRLADRMPARTLLLAGIAFLIAADVVLAIGTDAAWLGLGVALWGLHMGFTQGLLAALVAQYAPAHQRGTAFGFFNLAMGIAMLLASAAAGAMWQFIGPASTFWTGAVLALVAGGVTMAATRR